MSAHYREVAGWCRAALNAGQRLNATMASIAYINAHYPGDSSLDDELEDAYQTARTAARYWNRYCDHVVVNGRDLRLLLTDTGAGLSDIVEKLDGVCGAHEQGPDGVEACYVCQAVEEAKRLLANHRKYQEQEG
jgi:hypothetical protein